MITTIQVRERPLGGYLPVCEQSKLFCALIQNYFLDSDRIRIIKQLGFTVEIVEHGRIL